MVSILEQQFNQFLKELKLLSDHWKDGVWPSTIEDYRSRQDHWNKHLVYRTYADLSGMDWAKLPMKRLEDEWRDAPEAVDMRIRDFCERFLIRETQAKEKSEQDRQKADQEQQEAEKNAADKQAALAGLWPTAADDEAAPPPKWLIEGLIQEDTHIGLYAPKQFLKSFAAIDLAMAVATGRPALGTLQVNDPGVVFYFCAEGYTDVRTRRRPAWEIANGFDPFKSTDQIYFADGAPIMDNRLIDYIVGMKARLAQRSANASQEASLLAERPANADHRAKLIVIDTLNRALAGEDEDRASTASKYLNIAKAMADQVGGATLTVSHTGKNGERGMRGSSAFTAGFDTVLRITDHHKNQETGVHTICILVEYQKGGNEADEFFMQSKIVETPRGASLALVMVAEDIARPILEGASVAGDKSGKFSPINQTAVDAALKDLCPNDEDVSTGELAALVAQMTGRSTDTVRHTLADKAKTDLARFVRYTNNQGHNRWARPRWDLMSDQARETVETINAMRNGHLSH